MILVYMQLSPLKEAVADTWLTVITVWADSNSNMWYDMVWSASNNTVVRYGLTNKTM